MYVCMYVKSISLTDLSAGRSFAGARRYGADQVISLDGLLQWWSPLFLSRSRRPDHLPHTCPISPSLASGYLQMFTLDTAVCLLLSYSWVSDCGRRFTPSRHPDDKGGCSCTLSLSPSPSLSLSLSPSLHKVYINTQRGSHHYKTWFLPPALPPPLQN